MPLHCQEIKYKNLQIATLVYGSIELFYSYSHIFVTNS